GSTGLLIAQGLKQAGVSFSIWEREDPSTYAHREREWTMALHWGREHIANTLPEDIARDIHLIQPEPELVMSEEDETSAPFINAKTGEIIARIPAVSSRRASRRRLRALFSRGLDIQYGKKLVDYKDDGDKVTAIFHDGTVETGDMIIGADSANSTVRTFVLEPYDNILHVEPTMVMNFSTTYTREQALYLKGKYHPVLQMYPAHPDQPTLALFTLADIKDKDRPETWVFQMYLSIWGTNDYPPTNDERVKLFKKYGENYCEPFRSATRWVRDDQIITPDKYRVWCRPTQWDNHGGRITLAGDAAHPMGPHRGQGLNNALEDASQLNRAIRAIVAGELPIKDAIDAYDAEVLARGSKEIQVSCRQGYSNHFWDVWQRSVTRKNGMFKVKEQGQDFNKSAGKVKGEKSVAAHGVPA
ncbi:FAD/NAD(P)-binding domain-containing protein, partial [Rhizodiscina lignyota]